MPGAKMKIKKGGKAVLNLLGNQRYSSRGERGASSQLKATDASSSAAASANIFSPATIWIGWSYMQLDIGGSRSIMRQVSQVSKSVSQSHDVRTTTDIRTQSIIMYVLD